MDPRVMVATIGAKAGSAAAGGLPSTAAYLSESSCSVLSSSSLFPIGIFVRRDIVVACPKDTLGRLCQELPSEALCVCARYQNGLHAVLQPRGRFGSWRLPFTFSLMPTRLLAALGSQCYHRCHHRDL